MPNPPDTSTGYSCYPRIAIERGDTLHLVWEERGGGYNGFYSYHVDDYWSQPRRLMDTCDARNPQILCAGDNVILFWWSAIRNPNVGIGVYGSWRDSCGIWYPPAPATTNSRAGMVTATYDLSNKIHLAWGNAGFIEYCWEMAGSNGISMEQNTPLKKKH